MIINNPFGLENKTILVTGASSGIGKATAIECSKLGANLIITGRDQARLDDTMQKLESSRHLRFIADLNQNDQLTGMVDQLPALNGIVCNAGIAIPKLFAFTSNDELHSIFNSNFFSNVSLLRELIQKKKLSKNASVVFVSSIAGNFITSPGSSIYGASKAAITALSKGLALELSGKGIRVNSVSAGMIETNIMNESSISAQDLEEDKKKYPLGRYGKPEDVSYAIIYLLSDASSWLTGTNILLDGGYTLK
jgi:NAD(P)-dependent dehydrogenase (short-subunit alcohol dehydrogenase family)